MNKVSLLIFGFFILSYSFGQEICDNAIDDDGDGLIDLNDDDCDCGEILVIDWDSNIVPNHSFEEKSCCPSGVSDDACVDDWHNVGTGTSDYLNICDYWTIGVGPDYPLPSPGDGYVGFWPGEAIGCCLLTPLLAGETYLFSAQFSLESFWEEEPELILSIFGGNECVDYVDESVYACASGIYWEHIVRDTVMLLLDDSWAELTFYFTPTEDFYSLAFTPCLSGGYYYMDDVFIGQDMPDGLAEIIEIGSYCNEDLMLEASVDTIGGTWQWYLDGEALLGEIGPTVDVMAYGLGDYSVVYFIDGECIRTNHILNLDEISASFDFVNICVGEEINFINTSEFDGVGTPEWIWDFGDAGTATDENPTHLYTDPGTYTVSLIGIVESGCNDTIEVDVTVHPIPEAHFEFIVGDLSSEDGATGGCSSSSFQFNDLTVIVDPETIVSWHWDFGDASSSIEEGPIHIFDAAGTYTVTLTIETESGCTAAVSLEIIITDPLSIDPLFNEPTCFGFSDGSITVNTIGGGGELIYEITDVDDDLLNEDNSNTANTLSEGWYYVNVSDGTDCLAVDSIYLSQPSELDISIDLTNPLCFGDETGIAVVTDVINYTGSVDGISYIWNPNPGGNSGLGENETGSMGAGDYTVTINDENGCSKVFDFTITEPDEMLFSQFDFEHAFCRLHEYQSGNGVVFGSASGGTPDYDYLWTNLDNGETSINSTWGGLNPGNYELTATDANGCILKQSMFLDSLNPIAAFTVNSDQLNADCQGTATIQVEFENESENFANTNSPDADTTFFWNLDDPTADWQVSHDVEEKFDTVFTPQGDTYFVNVCLVALNKNGCTDTVCKVITIYEPITFEDVNIFSPNGDGINDVFTFEFKSASIAEFNCVIVNRWGIVVHEINDINDGWDGTDKNGDPCTPGVYFYKYTAKADNATDIVGQGSLQIIFDK